MVLLLAGIVEQPDSDPILTTSSLIAQLHLQRALGPFVGGLGMSCTLRDYANLPLTLSRRTPGPSHTLVGLVLLLPIAPTAAAAPTRMLNPEIMLKAHVAAHVAPVAECRAAARPPSSACDRSNHGC